MTAMITNTLGNPRSRRILTIAVAALVVVTFLYSTSDTRYASHVKSKLPSSWQSQGQSQPSSSKQHTPPIIVEPIVLDQTCSTLPGAEDVLLVMKTGSSVVDKRLPIHFKTTFRCTPDFLVFSDLAQDFHGVQIHDSLDELHKYVDMSSPNLKYYEYLKKQYARKQQGWTGSFDPTDDDGDNIKLDGEEKDAAWEMDKYKNIPILRKSYAMYPDKKWFLFVDADTTIMWSNILTWLALLDHTKPIYTGSQNWIGDVEFAHGGSGYIISQTAARILADESDDKAKEHISFAEHECCGDMVLAHAFHDNNIALNGSWPNIQGSRPDTLDYDDVKWCHAAMTFHHTTAEQTEQLFRLEREMEGVRNVTYSDVFHAIIAPQLKPNISEWDNGSEERLYPPHRPEEDFNTDPTAAWEPRTAIEAEAPESFEGCREACKAVPNCLQFTFRPNVTSNGQPIDVYAGQCGLRMAIALGEKKETDDRGTVMSGFDLERIDLWTRKRRCKAAGFLTEWDDSGHLEPSRND